MAYKKMNKNNTLLVALCFIQGCSFIQNGKLEIAKTHPDLNYLPIGIPLIFGGFGSGIPITKNISITNDHVALVDYSNIIARHPYCDIALISADNSNKKIMPLGKIYQGEEITNYGFGVLGSVIKSTGTYHIDTQLSDYKKCITSLSDAAIKKGMSGGAVVNKKGELVGVLQSFGSEAPILHSSNKPYLINRYTYFVPILFLYDWIKFVVPELREAS